MERDAISAEEVRKRMDKQMAESTKMRLCDFVIYNDEQQLLIPQVLAIHEKLLILSKESSIKK
jgi:dephospho-CoA kinase